MQVILLPPAQMAQLVPTLRDLVLPDTQSDPSQNRKACPDFFGKPLFAPNNYRDTHNDNDDIKLNLANYKKIKY